MSLARGIVLQPEFSIDLEPDVATLYDLSRYKNDGVITAATYVQEPSGVWVLQFDGATTYTTHADEGFSKEAEDRTLLAWVKRGATVATDRIFGYGTWGADEAFDCCIVQTGALELVGHTNNYQSTGTPSTQDIWQLCGFVLAGGRIYFTVNAVADSDFATTIDTTLSGTAYIGCSIAGVTQNDMLGDLSIIFLNYALTPGQITSYFEKTKHWFGVHD